MDTLGFGCILPTAGRIGDFHPLERVPTGHTDKVLPKNGQNFYFALVFASNYDKILL
jgi:hypothetical protein